MSSTADKHSIGEIEQIQYPGGKDGMFRGHCGGCDYVTSPLSTSRGAQLTVQDHARARNKIERAEAIVAKLARVNDMAEETRQLLQEVEDLVRTDYISADGAEDNARPVSDLRVVHRMVFRREARRLLQDWEGFLAARKK